MESNRKPSEFPAIPPHESTRRTESPVKTAPTEAMPSTAPIPERVEAPVDPNRVEPVGQTLGEPGREHWDTKQPDPDPSASATDPPTPLKSSAPVKVPPTV
jgi:hypothetical protein